ncbi:unnamed protein product [Effrenium voratum]|nr:unnamed protein product [Effrenium voratum]
MAALVRAAASATAAASAAAARRFASRVVGGSLPGAWYNIQADLPAPLPPPLHPKELRPCTAEDFAPLFPMSLIEQEVSTERYVEIPGAVREVLELWRPTPLIRAERWEKLLGLPSNVKIFYKYEGTSPSGSHKTNTAVPQAYYNAEAGTKKITTETGAGQWGSALAWSGSQFGVPIEVYQVKVSYEQKPYRKAFIEACGAQIFPSPSRRTAFGAQQLQADPDCPGSLGIAISEAIEACVTSGGDAKYALGSVLSHVLMHQTVIGQEASEQLDFLGETPDVVVGCTGGGSNFAGIAFPFLGRKLREGQGPRFVAVEPAACPSLTRGVYCYDFGDSAKLTPLLKSHTLGSGFMPPSVHAGGLRYHGMAPLISHLKELKALEARAVRQTAAFAAGASFFRAEGIIPAPEATHAIEGALVEAKAAAAAGEARVILFNMCGHGHFDMFAWQKYAAGQIEDYEFPEDLLQAALKVPGSGMLAASGCSWHSTPLLELAEVAVLDVHYARHGLEDFFAGLLQPEFQFDCPTLLHALRRLVERVHSGEAALPGGHELDGLLEMATEIYSQLAACLKTEPSEVQGLRRAFRTERLVLLRPKLRSHPKRLMPEEAWWDTHPELSELESVQSLSLKNFYQDLRDFFLALGVHQEITRAALKALLERPTQVSSSRWTGLDVSDVEDLGLLQTSSNFRPPDWRAPDEEEAPEQAPQRGAEPNDFQPPRGGPRVPAIRSSEELRRIQQEEEARRAARRRQNEASDVIYAPPSAGAGAGAEPGATDSNSAASASNRTPSGAESHANGNSRESKSEEKVPDAESESLALLQQRLEQLSRECERRQQESFELRSRWAQAEDDAERYMKILQQFWDADHRLRDAS